MTYRLWGHMLGDPEIYRTKDEVAKARENEPILRLGRRLIELGCKESDLVRFDSEAEAIVAEAVEFAEASLAPEPADAFTDVFI
jgi:pyruvate dehydrogenase E1 component alpha subunit